MAEDLHEIHEHAEEAHHDPSLAPVTITMAILAVLVAAVGLLGHRAHTEELLLQTKVSNEWASYQAKNIRRHSYELFLDLLTVSEVRDSQNAAKIREKYTREVSRYRDEQKELETEARNLEKEVEHERARADRFDLGDVCLDAALVICSITLLTRRRLFWVVGSFLARCGSRGNRLLGGLS